MGKPIDAAVSFEVVVGNDSTDLAQSTRGIYIDSTANVAVHNENGIAVTWTNLVGGVIHPIQTTRILTTGTTAVQIIAVY